MSAAILDVCDGLVDDLRESWETVTGTAPIYPSEVKRMYIGPVGLDKLLGRKVWVFPASYSAENITRGPVDDEATKQNDFRIEVVVVERYTESDAIDSDAARGWIDERVTFVQDAIFGRINNYGKPDLLVASGRSPIFCESFEAVDVYDAERLDVHKVFWSRMEFLLREIR